MRTTEPETEPENELVPDGRTERFTVKMNIDTMLNCDTDFGRRFKECMVEAIDRYNHITFLASKLITLHVIRLRQEHNQVLSLSNREFMTCCNVVSRVREDQDLTPCRDGPLRITLDLLRSQLPADYVWPHRQGLAQALAWASINWIAIVQVDVCYHLSQRLERWIVLRLAADLAQQIPEKGLWRIASRIADSLGWNEKAAFARARSLGLPDPTRPNYTAPATLDELLGENLINSLGEALGVQSRGIIWTFFNQEILAGIGMALPLCPSRFQETSTWQIYFTFHLKMLVDTEQLAAHPLRHPEPADRPSRSWLRRKVEKMALLEGKTLSQTLKTKAMSWLLQRIITEQPGLPTKSLYKLSPSMLVKLEQKGQRTIDKISSGSFRPKKFLSNSRGTNRAFSALPQFSFGTRYMAVDNRVLKELLVTLWRCGYHPFPDGLPATAGPGIPMMAARQEFDDHQAEWWCRLFRLHRIRGIQVPGIPLPAGLPSRQTPRQFDFYMSTDGVGASFICRRPRRARPTSVTPMTVPYRVGSSTFVSIDPGLTDLAVGVRAELTWPRLPDGRVDMEARESMPSFGDDHRREFSISSASWHDAAYHNSARQVSLRLKREALDRGVDIDSTATTLPTSKTAQVARYLDHARASLAAFPVLFEHYKGERPMRWKTYCREQKALHSVCMRIKGNKRAKKEDVVVAYGDGRFGSTMKGKRAVPVKKLRKHLRRYVTVVPVDEFRTIRECSTHNGEHRERTGLAEEKDEGGGTRQTTPDLVRIHAQRDTNGAKGPSLHSVLYCHKCHTVWNRDVNAARNIAWVFWWMRVHGGGRPPGFGRR
ncbi:hypothetical protein V1509DRAFT_645536 [Lipomyces kononenkoae]